MANDDQSLVPVNVILVLPRHSGKGVRATNAKLLRICNLLTAEQPFVGRDPPATVPAFASPADAATALMPSVNNTQVATAAPRTGDAGLPLLVRLACIRTHISGSLPRVSGVGV